MQVNVEQFGDVAVARVEADYLDASNEEDLRRELAPTLASFRKIVLDLGRIQFMDSRGCGVILSCLKQLAGAGGDLKLCRPTPPVRSVFTMIRLHKICEILDTAEEAVRAFQTGT